MAFSIKLGLKALSLFESGKAARGHDLKDLLHALSPSLQARIVADTGWPDSCHVPELSREDFRAFVLPNRQVRGMIGKVASDRLARTADLMERETRFPRDYIVWPGLALTCVSAAGSSRP